MTILIIVLVTGILIFLLAKNESKANESKSQYTNDPRDYYKEPSSRSNTRTFRIAGLTFRCTRKDIGIVMGKVGYDPGNKADPDAIAIIADIGLSTEKLLGYIPRDSQYAFRNLAKQKQELPFVGYIEEFKNDDNEWKLYGKIRVYNGQMSDVEKDMEEDLKALTKAFNENRYSTRMDLLDIW